MSRKNRKPARVSKPELRALFARRYRTTSVPAPQAPTAADVLAAALASPLHDAPRIPTQQEADAVADRIKAAVERRNRADRALVRATSSEQHTAALAAADSAHSDVLAARVSLDKGVPASFVTEQEAARRRRSEAARKGAATRAANKAAAARELVNA